MAYERTWQFLAPQGPRIATTTPEALAWWLWNIKAFVTGQNGGATQGLWTIVGSSDGVTAGMDGADRWTATFTPNLIPFGASAVAKGWTVLSRIWGAKTVYLILGNGTNAATGTLDYMAYFCGTLPTGGTTTNIPTGTNILGGMSIAVLGSLISAGYGANFVNGRSIYGGLTSTGDFWMAETILGEIANGINFQNPVGCKLNDQWPFYGYAMTTGNMSAQVGAVFASNSIFGTGANQLQTNIGTGTSATLLYNGASGWHFLVPPPESKLTDVADISLFDYPAWVLVSGSFSNLTTSLHARGRLADIGICSGSGYTSQQTGAASRPVNVGTTIRDLSNNVVYVTMNQLVVPYNTLVS